MKKKNFLWSMLVIGMTAMLSVGFTSCNGEDPEIIVNQTSVNFPENGGTQTIQVTSNADWNVSGIPVWLTVAPTQGKKKNKTLTITAQANTDDKDRSCVLYVNADGALAMVNVSQSGHTKSTSIRITNNSNYTLDRFTVHFVNSRFEELSTRDFGTLYSGNTITAEIPTGATEYYMATYASSRWFFSANYDISIANMTLTTAEVDRWSANASANRYPMASSAN